MAKQPCKLDKAVEMTSVRICGVTHRDGVGNGVLKESSWMNDDVILKIERGMYVEMVWTWLMNVRRSKYLQRIINLIWPDL